MIDTREDQMTGGIGRGGIVNYCSKAIFPNQFGAARQAKLKLLAKGFFDPVLRIADRGLSVLDAVERVACYHRKSRRPVISQRKNIARVEVIGNHVFRTHIRPEIRRRLVSAEDAGVKRKPCGELMRERHGDISVHIVPAHIKILVKAPDTKPKKLCRFPGSIISEDNVFADEQRAFAAGS